uniref:NADH dehydrogenase subunit 4 n=1 Tax=Stigmaeopsis continentalis TaxID=2547534 RepID=UPI00286B7914|nr:NADH dehydrogenase subunit 4 [Stigmaeopsis continentalis]WKW93606.1 NADH dehydrogenase subunit 4 [Stigmaeopsis continentalis]
MSFMFYYLCSSNFFCFYLFIVLLNLISFNFMTMFMLFMLFVLMKMIFFSFSEKMINYYFTMKMFIFKFMLICIYMFFFLENVFLFYIMFELVSFMIFFLVYMSSFSVKRFTASLYLFIFMSMGTFPMLVMMYFMNESTFIFIFSLSFLIKIPVVFFHMWLPKAHVEANYYDSMMLASLLLKLGGYGLLLMDFVEKFNFFFLWCMFVTLLMSFFMLFIVDLKMIFAFSSIVHMNLMLVSFLGSSFFFEVFFSLYMITHAFCSSLMFYMIGMLYEHSASRSILINKNLLLNFFFFFFFIFFCLFINMSTPPFLTFYSEMYIFFSVMSFSLNFIFVLILIVFISVMFNLIIIKSMGMMVLNNFFKLFNIKIKSFILIMEHLFYLFFFFY